MKMLKSFSFLIEKPILLNSNSIGGLKMNHFFNMFFGLTTVFFIGSCNRVTYPEQDQQPRNSEEYKEFEKVTYPEQDQQPRNYEQTKTEEEYEEIKRNDKDRRSVLDRESKRHSSQTCEELDRRDDEKEKDDCEEKCSDMYKNRGDRSDCEELPVTLIEDLFDMYENNLSDADDLDLIDIDLFDAYTNVSIQGLERVIDNYSSNEAEDFLTWLIDTPEALSVFKKEDRDFLLLESLFKSFDDNYNRGNIYDTFTKNLDGDDIMEIAILEGDEVVEWFMDFINEKNKACEDDTETRACFKVYCKIGDELDEDTRDDWSDIDEFEDYLEDIIDEKVNSRQGEGTNRNSTGWIYGNKNIEGLNDLSNDWVRELCHGLK